MTNANIERFDPAGNSYGMMPKTLRNVAENLESESAPLGTIDIFGEIVTRETIARDIKLTQERMAGLLIKLAAQLRAGQQDPD